MAVKINHRLVKLKRCANMLFLWVFQMKISFWITPVGDYDTCFRAKAIFGVKSALLVTQKFHLPRELFLCNTLWLTASGVEANNRNYYYWMVSLLLWNIHEQSAIMPAFLAIYVEKPSPILAYRS